MGQEHFSTGYSRIRIRIDNLSWEQHSSIGGASAYTNTLSTKPFLEIVSIENFVDSFGKLKTITDYLPHGR
jgi:hypothetical protein